MTIVDDAVQDQADIWFDPEDLAINATYRPGGQGSGSTVPVCILYGEDPGQEDRYYMDKATIVVPASQVTDPEENDTIEIGSDLWTVRKVGTGNRVAWLLQCEKRVRATA